MSNHFLFFLHGQNILEYFRKSSHFEQIFGYITIEIKIYVLLADIQLNNALKYVLFCDEKIKIYLL